MTQHRVLSSVLASFDMPMQLDRELFWSWLAGGLSNAATSALLNPLDVCKTRMQAVQPRLGLLQTARIAVREQGFVRGLLLPGLTPSIVREMLSSGPRAGLYVPVRDWAIATTGSHKDSLLMKLLAASACGVVGSVIANPVDVVKVRMMVKSSSPPLSTSLFMVWREEGIRGLYKGLSPSTLRACFIAAGELGTYDIAKTSLRGLFGQSEGMSLHVAASLVTGVVAAVVAAPFDVLKTRMMLSSSSSSAAGVVGGKGGEQGLVATALSLVRTEGTGALLRGVVPSYLRLGPHALISFPLLEQLRCAFGLDFV